jgi:hypothetical protein
MAEWTWDAIKELLIEKLKKKTAELKADGEAVTLSALSSSLLLVVGALCADARRREHVYIRKYVAKHGAEKLESFLNARADELQKHSVALFDAEKKKGR